MKSKSLTKLSLAMLAACSISFMPGCTDSQVESALPEIQLATQGGTAFAIQELKLPVAEVNNIEQIAVCLKSATSGTVAPTVAELKKALAPYATDAGSAAIGSLVQSLYAQYYPALAASGGTVWIDLLNTLATGVENGAYGGATPAATVAVMPYRRVIVAMLEAGDWNEHPTSNVQHPILNRGTDNNDHRVVWIPYGARQHLK